jgi:cysteine desulfurase/selenocysteine lyase
VLDVPRLHLKFEANWQLRIANAMSTYQLDFIGGDASSQLEVDERKSKYLELAAFMNAEPDEIGTSLYASAIL